MWVWVKKHRKFIFLSAAAAVGAYVGGRYLIRKTSSLQQQQRSDHLEGQRLKEHLDSNQQICLNAIWGLVPSLRDVIMGQLNAEAITAQLREKPANKVVLWENLKVISFSRLVVAVYGCSLLTVFLRVQLSILGGCMFLDWKKSPVEASPSSDIQKQYLSSVQYFINEGVRALMEIVHNAAEMVLAGYSLKHQISCEGMLQLVLDIRRQTTQLMAGGVRPEGDRRGCLSQFLLPKETMLETQISRDLLMNSTRDVLESVDFDWVLERTIEQAFSELDRNITEAFHSAAQSTPTLPLARVIPLACDHSQLVIAVGGGRGRGQLQASPSLLQQLLSCRELQALSENIYEAFSHAD